jgi:hypothetical protein
MDYAAKELIDLVAPAGETIESKGNRKVEIGTVDE